MSAGAFDFWLGRWEVRWGEGARGTNEITKVMDDRVVLERFDGRPGTELVGMSVSVYDPDDRLWRQTWVDSQAAISSSTGTPGTASWSCAASTAASRAGWSGATSRTRR